MAKSYYEILGVDSKATEAEVRKAYRKMIREFHPDLNPEKAKAHKRSRELNVALEVLTNSTKRKRYDEKLRRMGKEKANADFDFTSNKKQSRDHDMPEFDFNTKNDEPKSKKTKANARSSKQKKLHPIWMVLSLPTAGISAVCVALMFLWVFFRTDPTGLIATKTPDVNASSAAQVQLLKDEIVKLKSSAERSTDPGSSAKEVIRLMTSKIESLKLENQKLARRIGENKSQPDTSPEAQTLLLDDPKLVPLVKNWLVEYRYAQQLIKTNKWKHHWWHPTAQADWSGNNGVAVQVRMQPVVWHGEEQFFLTDSKSKGKRWSGLFLPLMRPMVLVPSGNLNESDKARITREVALQLNSSSEAGATSETSNRIFNCSTHRIAEQEFRLTIPNRKPEDWRFRSDGRIEYRPAGGKFRIGASIWRPIDENRIITFHDGPNFVDIVQLTKAGDTFSLSAITNTHNGKMKPHFTITGKQIGSE